MAKDTMEVFGVGLHPMAARLAYSYMSTIAYTLIYFLMGLFGGFFIIPISSIKEMVS